MASSPVFAQWYGGVSAGVTSTSISDSVLSVTGATAFSVTKDERDAGFKLQAGYQFSPNWGLEFGYVDVGKFKATNSVTAPVVGTVSGVGKGAGWNAVAVGILPLSDGFSLLGKLGAIYSSTKLDLATSGAVALTAGTATSREKSEWNLAYGLGVQRDLSKTVSIRAEWDRFDKVGDASTTGEYNVNLYSIGLNFKF